MAPGATRQRDRATRALMVLPNRWCASAWVLALATGLTACASTGVANPSVLALAPPPDWSHPAVTLTDQATVLTGWWQRFSDPLLTTLVEDALVASTELTTARATVQQAAALRDAAQAALSPQVGYSAGAQRNFSGDASAANSFTAGLNANWDTDIFGAKQSALDAGNANVRAALARQGFVQATVASGVALGYITLRSGQVRLAIAQTNLATQLDTLQITRWRNQAGLVGAIEVEQAIVAAGQTRAQLQPLQSGVEAAAYSLTVQTGRAPAALLNVLLDGTQVAVVPQAQQGLVLASPREALLLRADVRAAQYLVDKALADVAQARTGNQPKLAMGATLGVGAASINALSGGSAALAGLALNVAGPLLDGGAVDAQVRVQQAVLAQAQSGLRAAELAALRDVEGALSALRSDRERTVQLEAVARAAANAATMARQRYASGLVDFQTVLETQRSLLATQDSLAQAHADQGSNQVRLYLALGGGWRATSYSPPAPTPPSP